MSRQQQLPYLPAMFAACMLFQSLYLLCILLYFLAPGVPGHALLTQTFPTFNLLDVPSFFYGLVMSMMYGWFIAVIFVFFYNLWPRFAAVLTSSKTAAS